MSVEVSLGPRDECCDSYTVVFYGGGAGGQQKVELV